MNAFRQDRIAGTLLGTAVNDGSGTATAQSALVASCLVSAGASPGDLMASFRRALVGWALRHAWSADVETLQACGRIALGVSRTGTLEPTSGAAARAAIVGAALPFDAEMRRAAGRALAEVTHANVRSVEAALFVAEVAAACSAAPANGDRVAMVDRARSVVRSPDLVVALHYALELAEKKVTMGLAVRELGVGAAAVAAVPLATFAFVRFGDSPRLAMDHFVEAAGEAARPGRTILGAWVGTYAGAACLPWDQMARLREGPFGPNHLRELAANLAACDELEPWSPPSGVAQPPIGIDGLEGCR